MLRRGVGGSILWSPGGVWVAEIGASKGGGCSQFRETPDQDPGFVFPFNGQILSQQVTWTPECETTFQKLKTNLVQASVLVAPEPKKTFYCAHQCFNLRIGGCTEPDWAIRGWPCGKINHKLLPGKVVYTSEEKEYLVLVWVLKKLHTYLYGRSLAVLANLNPLVWLNWVYINNMCLLLWSLALQNTTSWFSTGWGNRTVLGMDCSVKLSWCPLSSGFLFWPASSGPIHRSHQVWQVNGQRGRTVKTRAEERSSHFNTLI